MSTPPAVTAEAVDRFKETFKRYKKKNADLNDTIDFSRSSQLDPEVNNST